MALVQINKNPGKRELSWFGVMFLAFAALLSAVLYWGRGAQTAGVVVLAVASVLTTVYYAVPRLRRTMYLAWMYAAMPIGAAVSMLLLVFAYFLVFTPIGLLVRLFSHDPMTRTFERGAGTYWVRRPPPPPASRYFRQF